MKKNKAKYFLIKLFLGNKKDNRNLNPAINNQWKNVKRVWNNQEYNDFGLERLLRLFLVLIQFVFPILYIRHLSGKRGLISRKIWIEIYVLSKVLLAFLIIFFNLAANIFSLLLIIYLLLETICYLLYLIFLSDVNAEPINYKRSLLFIFINFFEIGLEYSVIYLFFYNHLPNFLTGIFSTKIDIVYFSFVSLSTLGFGEIHPTHSIGKIIVISQIFVFLIFVGLFLNYYASRVQNLTYYNTKKKKKSKSNHNKKEANN